MKTCVKSAICLAAVLALSACTERIIPGRYLLMGYTLTFEALDDSIEITHGPVFEFSADGKTVAVSNDFSFGCFQDSLYEYKYSKGILHLRGGSVSKDIFCEPHPNSLGYDMFLDEKYVQRISIRRVEE